MSSCKTYGKIITSCKRITLEDLFRLVQCCRQVLRNKNFNMDCMNVFQLIKEHKQSLKEKNDISREKNRCSLKKQNEGTKLNKKKKKGKIAILCSISPILHYHLQILCKKEFVSITPTFVESNHCPVSTKFQPFLILVQRRL